MDNYKEYVEAVNKIFELVEKMKKKWPEQDNLDYLKKIEEYKEDVIKTANLIRSGKTVEELGQ